MNCSICDDLGLLSLVVENMEVKVRGLDELINTILIAHLSVRHDRTLRDLPAVSSEVWERVTARRRRAWRDATQEGPKPCGPRP
jgi:hypothetical protein